MSSISVTLSLFSEPPNVHDSVLTLNSPTRTLSSFESHTWKLEPSKFQKVLTQKKEGKSTKKLEVKTQKVITRE